MFHPRHFKARPGLSLSLALTFLLPALLLPTRGAQRAPAGSNDGRLEAIPNIPPGAAYRRTNLISDVPGLAPVLAPALVNP